MALVEIENLRYSVAENRVIDGVDLSIDAGVTLGLVGPNGGGKTTLIKLILGLLEPTGGQIRVAGLPPRQAVRRGDLIGYLPQRARVPARFPASVRQTVQMGLAGKAGLLRHPSADDLAFVEHLLQRVGLTELADKPVNALSGGQIQRTFIARALAPRPRILLLDEPTVGIDRAGEQRFIEFIEELKAELKLTVLFVSHDLRAVTAIADRIACLNCTLHYHDVPDHLPAELVYRMFACDLEAMGIRDGHACTHGAPKPSGAIDEIRMTNDESERREEVAGCCGHETSRPHQHKPVAVRADQPAHVEV